MSDTVELIVNGSAMRALRGSTVASALLGSGETTFRSSPTGETRAPLCGMGVCFECRVTIDGVPHQRACMTLVRDRMNVVTGPLK